MYTPNATPSKGTIGYKLELSKKCLKKITPKKWGNKTTPKYVCTYIHNMLIKSKSIAMFSINNDGIQTRILRLM
jgi:hypothetical protein